MLKPTIGPLSFKILSFFIIFFCVFTAKSAPKSFTKYLNKDWNFVRNDGQLTPSNGENVLYYGQSNGVGVYFYKSKISFVFCKNTGQKFNDLRDPNSAMNAPEVPSPSTLEKVDMEFTGANESALVLSDNISKGYSNFYLENCPNGITNVPSFKTLKYSDIYPNIDMFINCKESGIEYGFIVKKGGNAADIKITWHNNGANESNPDGLIHSCGLGEIHETNPMANLENGKAVNSSFLQKDNTVGFNIGQYPVDETLIIDPSVTWASYYGGAGTERGIGICTDLNANVFITGITWGSTNMATSGAYMTSSSGTEAFLAEFDSSGNRVWGTYYGGGNQEQGFTVAAFEGKHVYMGGVAYYDTIKGTALATASAHQTKYGGGISDGFLVKFDYSGKREWATYYGGSGQDNIAYVSVGPKGDLYFTGTTQSSSAISTSGAFRTKPGSNINPFFGKFDSSGTLMWASYFGDNAAGEAYSITATSNNFVYIAGWTSASKGISTSGTYQSTFGGSFDAYISRFDCNGNQIWGSYMGAKGYEYPTGSAMAEKEGVYIGGLMYDTSWHATKGAYQTKLRSQVDAFVAQFDSTGNMNWSTLYGGSNDDVPLGLCGEPGGGVYITGYTKSKDHISTTDGLKTRMLGKDSTDAFIAYFDKNGGLRYGSYFGGPANDLGSGICSGLKGNVYIIGETSSSSGIAGSSAFQTKLGGTLDAFFTNQQFPYFAIASGASSVCKGTISAYSLSSKQGDSTYWNIKNGTVLSMKKDSIWVQWNTAGTGAVQAIEIDSVYKDRDTDQIIVTVLPPVDSIIKGLPTVCSNVSGNYYVNNAKGNTYKWSVSGASISGSNTDSLVNIVWGSGGLAKIHLVASNSMGCSDSSDLIVSVHTPIVSVIRKSHDSLFSSIGKSYQWILDGHSISGATLPSYVVNKKGNYSVLVTDSNGCSANSSGLQLNRIIKGKVSTSTGGPLVKSLIYMGKYNPADTSVAITDSMSTDSFGNYLFASDDSLIYLVAFPDLTRYSKEMPTWADSSADFYSARNIHLPFDTTIENFKTLYGSNPGGAGTVGGKITLCSLCKTYGSGLPAKHIRVILADSNGRVQRYTWTDASGRFNFGNVAITKYRVWVDVPMVDNVSSAPIVKLNAANPMDTGLVFTLYPTVLELNLTSGIEKISNDHFFKIHPNPASGKLNIDFESNISETNILILDLQGREIISSRIPADMMTCQMDVSHLPQGMYMLKLKNKDGVIVQKFMKN